MNKILVIAPHPDDETLGCGGTLLKYRGEGHQIYWLIVTTFTQGQGFSSKQISTRKNEIEKVAAYYQFNDYKQLDFLTTELDIIPKKEMISSISDYINFVEPDTVLLPYPYDVHSDHRAVFEAAIPCTKSFRCPFIKSVRVYETLSETEFGLFPDKFSFRPNVWVDIGNHLEQKIEIMKIYQSEFGIHPFPRSEQNIRALSTLRGATIGVIASESFISLKEII